MKESLAPSVENGEKPDCVGYFRTADPLLKTSGPAGA
jgi:hypothetical protein